jgi:hypothetical protein
LEYNETLLQLFIDFKQAYDSVREELLYSILIEFGATTKLVMLIKMCLNETYSNVRIDRHLSEISYPKWFKTRKCSITTPFNFDLEYAIRKVQESQL